MRKYRFLILRRFIQCLILSLYTLSSYYGVKILQGNLSGSLLFETIPLSDPFALLQLSFSGAIVGLNSLLGGLIIILFYGIFFGRAFCSFVCPMNLISDLASFVRKTLKIRGSLFVISRNTRYVVFGLSLVLSFIFGIPAFENISPITHIHRGLVFGIGFGGFVILSVFLFDIAIKHGFCGHVCPLGAFYSIISKFSILRVKYDLESCTKCMECKNICPENQVLDLITHHSGRVTSGECILCGRCIEVCGDNALEFSIIKGK